jgi:hypothetical protein
MSLLIPPPAAADVAVPQFVPPLEEDEDDPDEHPAASRASVAAPAKVKRQGVLTECLLYCLQGCAGPAGAGNDLAASVPKGLAEPRERHPTK